MTTLLEIGITSLPSMRLVAAVGMGVIIIFAVVVVHMLQERKDQFERRRSGPGPAKEKKTEAAEQWKKKNHAKSVGFIMQSIYFHAYMSRAKGSCIAWEACYC
jgi:hypothetical protein